jgi:hypothetical protein
VHSSATIFLETYLHQFYAVVQIMHFFRWYLGQILEIDAEITPSNGAIWDDSL